LDPYRRYLIDVAGFLETQKRSQPSTVTTSCFW
jgi:hypothetical protein